MGLATFGEITYGEFKCFSLENSEYLIETGTYTAQLDMSPHLGYKTPHLRVPKRDRVAGGDAGLRVHVANVPSQLQGCIAVGQELETSSVLHSRLVFEAFMRLLPETFSITIS